MIKLAMALMLAGAALPVGAIAAPFCLTIPNGTPRCMYYDGASCARDAGRQNGACQVNPAEINLPTSRVGDYCLIIPAVSQGAVTPTATSARVTPSHTRVRARSVPERPVRNCPRTMPPTPADKIYPLLSGF
jgi:hypothetical protein